MYKSKCKRCKGRFKTLINEVCACCNPEAWAKHFDKDKKK